LEQESIMKTIGKWVVASALMAAACGVAQAHTVISVRLGGWQPAYVAPQPVYVAPAVVPVYYGYGGYHGYGDRYGDHRGWDHGYRQGDGRGARDFHHDNRGYRD
jgi:hypothetical protein